MKFLALFFLIVLIACNTGIKYPDGGYDYPKHVADKDTNFYYYPIKDKEPRNDSFLDARSYTFFRPFNEPNLSIKPQPIETFRLTYSTVFGEAIIINLNKEGIIIKQGDPSGLYENNDSSLSAIEKFHLNILRKWFPLDDTIHNQKPYRRRYIDSLIKLYPRLLDVAYYKELSEKTYKIKEKKFVYPEHTISLTKDQYQSIIQQINASGYWSLPYEVKCDYPPYDGYRFTLEANTKRKYNVVTASACEDDTTSFTKACQKIIDMTKLGNKVHLIWKYKGDIVPVESNTPNPEHKVSSH